MIYVILQVLSIHDNVLGINEGGMVNGAMSRKVEITLNSAVSLVQTLQPLLFIPCYKSGGGVNQRKRVGMTYLPTMEVKNVNRCFRHLLITHLYQQLTMLTTMKNSTLEKYKKVKYICKNVWWLQISDLYLYHH
jgi:hypothetical protein